MAQLLHIEASPRGDDSHSIHVAREFIDAYRQTNPDDEVRTINLFDAQLPTFRAPAAKAKYTLLAGNEPSGEAESAWQPVIETVDRLKQADKVLISSPMWNFGVPYPLKHYIDVIVQPGLTFSFDAELGYQGLVTDRPLALVVARGSAYAKGTGAEQHDYQLPYLKSVFGLIGFTDMRSIVVEPTMPAEMGREDMMIRAAVEQARDEAKRF
ncbi:MAG: FMN-dependent NADH-azoreductase [Phycisphaerae bacterium]